MLETILYTSEDTVKLQALPGYYVTCRSLFHNELMHLGRKQCSHSLPDHYLLFIYWALVEPSTILLRAYRYQFWMI
jgi:hypothetical protein